MAHIKIQIEVNSVEEIELIDEKEAKTFISKIANIYWAISYFVDIYVLVL